MTLTYQQSGAAEDKAFKHILEDNKTDKELDKELLEWAFDGAAYGLQVENPERLTSDEWEELLDSAQSRLEECDCAGCSSPAPVYTQAMVEKLAQVWDEVDEALEEYQDATGDNWQPTRKQALTVGAILWFAYEWRASQLASWLDSEKGVLALELADNQ
ncbi:MAG: hypothetical protein ACK5PR_01725 [bacterium]|jgi:hypothetical protein